MNPAVSPAEARTDAADATQVTARNQVQDRLIQNRENLPSQHQFVNNSVVKAKDPIPGQAASEAPAPPSMVLLPASPDAPPRWMVNSAGLLQRSFDKGITWENVDPSANLASADDQVAGESKAGAEAAAAWRTVVAIGLEVWAGGSDSALYHTTNGGNRWARVMLHAGGAALTGDITSIQFADPQHGKIATSTAELWTTSDGGQTWLRQQ